MILPQHKNLARCHECIRINVGFGGKLGCVVDGSKIKERAEKGDCQRGYHKDDRAIEPIGPVGGLREPETVDTAGGESKPRPKPTMAMAAAWAMAAAFGKWASDGEAAERLAVCDRCDKLGEDKDGKYCKVCGCGVFADDRAVKNLAAYRENLRGLPGYNAKLPQWGCKHPKRGEFKNPVPASGDGGERFGWKRPGMPLPVLS